MARVSVSINKYKYVLTIFMKGGNDFSFTNYFDINKDVRLMEWAVGFMNLYWNNNNMDIHSKDYTHYFYEETKIETRENRMAFIIRKNISFFILEKTLEKVEV